jgi:hypothetical protein
VSGSFLTKYNKLATTKICDMNTTENIGTLRGIGSIPRKCPSESAAMKHLHDSQYVFIEPIRPAFPFLIVLGVLVVVVSLAAEWLNSLPVQFVGPILYPIERVLNAAFFPEAQTPLRPNGSALLVLLPTVALFAAIYLTARGMFRAAMRALGPFIGRR